VLCQRGAGLELEFVASIQKQNQLVEPAPAAQNTVAEGGGGAACDELPNGGDLTEDEAETGSVPSQLAEPQGGKEEGSVEVEGGVRGRVGVGVRLSVGSSCELHHLSDAPLDVVSEELASPLAEHEEVVEEAQARVEQFLPAPRSRGGVAASLGGRVKTRGRDQGAEEAKLARR
jgi:hypothetical protein